MESKKWTYKNTKSDLDFGWPANIYWRIFGQAIIYIKVDTFLNHIHRFLDHDSVTDIKWAFLCSSVKIKRHIASKEQFINIMCSKKYLVNFLMQKHFGHFWMIVSVSMDFRLDIILEMSESYTSTKKHPYLCMACSMSEDDLLGVFDQWLHLKYQSQNFG